MPPFACPPVSHLSLDTHTTVTDCYKVTKDQEVKIWSYEAPKLAMVVASPVIRDHFVQNPDSTEIYVNNSNSKVKAIEAIAHWLRIAISVPKLGNIHLSKISPKMSNADLKESLDIRGKSCPLYFCTLKTLTSPSRPATSWNE